VFIASEALAAGLITRYELAVDCRRLFPDVYAPKRTELSLDERFTAAWLWSRRRGVITGWAASALHGARWFDPAAPIEVNLDHNKSPAGVITRRDTLLDGEVMRIRGIPVTSVERTAFDLARGTSTGIAL
jgi:hypothetical protein